MWDLVVSAAQSHALHWTVVVGAVGALVWKGKDERTSHVLDDLNAEDLDI